MTDLWCGVSAMSEEKLLKTINAEGSLGRNGSVQTHLKIRGLRWSGIKAVAIIYATTDPVGTEMSRNTVYDVLFQAETDAHFEHDKAIRESEILPTVTRVVYVRREKDDYLIRRANLEQILYE